ncbi:hypothetical protein [Caloramator sp. Dgby_cultured_2]|uniref:hypothetical protein n=1 Tax=Caloramator sp. Dgby_cultured_2 TaxID=3029174 RepID=UPI00237ECE42|nr:hypothetical protein [Caloramator sp. Dgby_cultured_2]WDU82523.1 hypothetical protein PWK10_13020 [Caloramator sp. Dgby_cultured_2]
MQKLETGKTAKINFTKSYKNKKQLEKILLFSVAVILATLWLLPLLWIVSTAFKPESDVIDPIVRWIPKRVTLDNFRIIFSDKENAPILRWFFNSLFIALSHTILILLFDSLAAFAYARLKFKYKETIYWTMMATMMIPGL